MNTLTSQPLRILVVDDDAAIRRTYQQIFEPAATPSAGLSALVGASPPEYIEAERFELILADQGETAASLHSAALAEGRPCHVAFIDMRMPPGWDGLRTALALRAQDPSIYIVISTAFADYDVAELQQALGHDVVLLRKPFSREEAYQLALTLGQSWHTRQRLERTTADIEHQVFARSAELEKRISQQQALAEIATRCVELGAADDLDDAVHWSLARLGKVTGADRASLIRLSPDGHNYSMSHEWLALGMPSLCDRIKDLPVADFRGALTHLRRGGSFRFGSLAEMPEELAGLRALLQGEIEAISSVPIMTGETMAGLLSISAAQPGNHWDSHDEALLRTAGHLLERTLEVREAQQHLALSEANFSALVQNIPGLVYRCKLDDNWTMLFLSGYIETLSGYPLNDFIDNRRRSYASLIHPDDVDLVDRHVRDALAHHRPYDMAYRIVHANGGIRWVYERGQGSWNSAGELTWLEGVITDMTPQKRLETALAATAEFVSAPGDGSFCAKLVRHAAITLGLDYVHVARLLPDGAHVETEAAWLDGKAIENWGYALCDTPCSEVLALTRRLIESNVQTRYPKDADLSKVGAEGYVGEPIVDARGKVLGLIVGITRSPMDNSGMVQGNLRILAARTAAEWQQRDALLALQLERDTVRNLLQTAEAIIVALDRDGRITLINRKGCELLGSSEAELIGQDWFATCLPADADLETIRTVFRNALDGDLAGSEYFENPVRTRSGETRLIAWHNSSIRDAEGRVIGGMSAGMDITERRLAEVRLQASEARFHHLFDAADALSIQGYLADGTVAYWNRASEALYGYNAAEAIGANLYDLIIPDAMRPAVVDAVNRMFETGQPSPPGRLVLKHKDGGKVPVYSSHTIVEAPGQAALMFCMDIDLSELDRTEAALNVALAKYKTLFDCFPMGITVSDAQGQVLETNAAAERLLGVQSKTHRQRAIDHPDWHVLRADGTPMPAEEYASVRALKERRRIEDVEMGVVRDDGCTTWLSVTADILPLEGYGVVVTYGDITARRAAEERIHEMAYLDDLTGLPNRRLLMDRFERARAASERSGEYGALMILDIDHFKEINDNHGHAVGDLLLVEVARRLRNEVRQIDTVARLGGDEYVVMLENLDVSADLAEAEARTVAEKLRQAVAQPYALTPDAAAYRSSASIGASLFRGARHTADDVLRQADRALYRAKDDGRNCLRFSSM